MTGIGTVMGYTCIARTMHAHTHIHIQLPVIQERMMF